MGIPISTACPAFLIVLFVVFLIFQLARLNKWKNEGFRNGNNTVLQNFPRDD